MEARSEETEQGELQTPTRETYHCVRVSPDGSAKSTIRDADGLRLWLRVNRTFRPMNALFVNGRPQRLEDYGSFSAEQVARLSDSLEIESLQVSRDRIDAEPIEHQHPSLAYEIGECRSVH